MNLYAKSLSELLSHCQRLLGRPLTQEIPEVTRRIGLLSKREESLSDCLLVSILGGTKVGKSALINALAGRVIAESSPKACYTSRPSIFVHKSREMQARTRLSGVIQAGDKVEIHEEQLLERLILIDTPDFDGVEVSHRGVFQSVLERSDLALCVITTQKYDLWSLYEILASAMGFRRTVFVFNRIDEGIPLSERIRQDFMAKISRFNLKPPEGEKLPFFAISAHYALQAKLEKQAGPMGEFIDLEKYLNEKLDQATVKRICEENLEALSLETRQFVLRSCRLTEAKAIISDIEQSTISCIEQTGERIQEALNESARQLSVELMHRREMAAARGLSGPFGMYLRIFLTFETFTRGLLLPSLSTFRQSLAEGLAERLEQSGTPALTSSLSQLRRSLTAKAERAGIDSAPLLARIDTDVGQSLPSARILEAIKEVLVEPQTSGFESFVLNILPISIVLLLVRYFVFALISAHEPSAGMFIGGGVLLFLVCYLEAAFWLPFKVGVVKPFTNVVKDVYLANMREKWLYPLQSWAEDVKAIEDKGKNLSERNFDGDRT